MHYGLERKPEKRRMRIKAKWREMKGMYMKTQHYGLYREE
jgi:hypothetical protein